MLQGARTPESLPRQTQMATCARYAVEVPAGLPSAVGGVCVGTACGALGMVRLLHFVGSMLMRA